LAAPGDPWEDSRAELALWSTLLLPIYVLWPGFLSRLLCIALCSASSGLLALTCVFFYELCRLPQERGLRCLAPLCYLLNCLL
jgi:hypothetical protein